MMNLRRQITERMTPGVLNKIRDAPKPTKVAEVIAVVKEFEGLALSLDEIAEVTNVADPGRNEKARVSDYVEEDISRHPDLRLLKTPKETYVRYTATRTLYAQK